MLTRQQLRPAAAVSTLTALLTLVAATGGLLIEDLYTPFMPTPQLQVGAYAQDLVAIFVAIALLGALSRALQGSLRALLLWTGCLTYLIYSYLLWSFDAIYTIFFPVYLVIFSSAIFSLITLLGKVDPAAFRSRVSAQMPRRALAAVLSIPAFMLPPWIAFAVQGARAGEPAAINTVLVLDLGFLIPACVLTAVLVWRRHPRGLIFAPALLVKMITTGGALVIATLWGSLRGVPLDPILPVYALMVATGGVALARYMRQISVEEPAGHPAVQMGLD